MLYALTIKYAFKILKYALYAKTSCVIFNLQLIISIFVPLPITYDASWQICFFIKFRALVMMLHCSATGF